MTYGIQNFLNCIFYTAFMDYHMWTFPGYRSPRVQHIDPNHRGPYVYLVESHEPYIHFQSWPGTTYKEVTVELREWACGGQSIGRFGVSDDRRVTWAQPHPRYTTQE